MKVRETCGTIAGYRYHTYKEETTCSVCRQAWSRYNKRLKVRQHLGLPTSTLIPILGTIRRLQALMCLGWPIAFVLKRAGVREQSIVHFEARERIHKEDADKIDTVYRELCMKVPSPKVVRQSSITITKNYATKRSYVPPLAWNDIDEDVFNPRHHLARIA